MRECKKRNNIYRLFIFRDNNTVDETSQFGINARNMYVSLSHGGFLIRQRQHQHFCLLFTERQKKNKFKSLFLDRE